jgi:hypothetical protein
MKTTPEDAKPQPRFNYRIYGLNLVSAVPLQEVQAVAQPEDVSPVLTIYFVEQVRSLPLHFPPDVGLIYTHPYRDEKGVSALQAWRYGNAYFLAYLNGGVFLVRHDRDEIWAVWPGKHDFGYVNAQILGPILGLVLQLRGFLVLHASVVTWKERAFAIVGPSGAGKSTLAAELFRQGCRVLSDDIAALEKQAGFWQVHPGYPRLRLWPEAAEALYGAQHNLRPIVPYYQPWNKRYLECEAQSGDTTAPSTISAIYLLNWDQAGAAQPVIAELTGVNRLANLDAHSFMEYLLDWEQRRRQMAAIVDLLSQVSIFQVQPKPDLAALPELGAAILDHFINIP